MPDAEPPAMPSDPALLRALAESPTVRPSVRVAARKALKAATAVGQEAKVAAIKAELPDDIGRRLRLDRPFG